MASRRCIILGILAGITAIGLWMSFVPALFESASRSAGNFERMALALRWAVIIQLPLIAGIVVVAQQRFWSPEHADGSAPKSGSAMDINKRYLTNTLEQSLLSTVGVLAFAATCPAQYLGFVPALALLFLFGRISFWVAYHVNSCARAFGLVLSFLPTLGVYAYLLSHMTA